MNTMKVAPTFKKVPDEELLFLLLIIGGLFAYVVWDWEISNVFNVYLSLL